MTVMMIAGASAFVQEAENKAAVIVLDDNPTTGYTWNYVVSNPAVAAMTEEYRSDPALRG